MVKLVDALLKKLENHHRFSLATPRQHSQDYDAHSFNYNMAGWLFGSSNFNSIGNIPHTFKATLPLLTDYQTQTGTFEPFSPFRTSLSLQFVL